MCSKKKLTKYFIIAILFFIGVCLCGNFLKAGTGKYVHVVPDPNDPNIPGYWTYVYTYSDGVTITIKNPVPVIKWQYWVVNDPNYVWESYVNPPFAEQVRPGRFTYTHGSFKKYTHEEWLKEKIIKHWLDPNDISGGFTMHDFAQLARCWDTPIITKPVYYRETSKIYHLKSCQYAQGEGLICVDVERAKKMGLRPCSVCNPYAEVPAPSPAPSPVIDPNTIPPEIREIIDVGSIDPNLFPINYKLKSYRLDVFSNVDMIRDIWLNDEQ